ncbi:MAG: STAS domain-containing protein [Planctomycetes bacterium]|nr:STAS domain-containing protein [Planctomycetota bacterium]
MEIKIEQRCAVTLVRPEGPLTSAEAETLKSTMLELIEENLGRVVLDASEIAYVDSRGLETLVEVTQELAPGGKALKLCAVNETLQQVLDLTDLASQFEQFEDANSAIRSFL